MEPRNTLIAIFISAILSSICTIYFAGSGDEQTASETQKLSDKALAELATLKRELEFESQARKSLETRIANLGNSPRLNTATDASVVERVQSIESTNQVAIDEATRQEQIQQFRDAQRAERLARQQPEYRQQQLVQAGFAQEEAARIVQIESEESLRQLQRQYDARRQRAASASVDNTNPIRRELGDENYERYLEANGWQTSATIGSVIPGSPGANAGLQAGDKIRSYAGERVFNLNEVNGLTIQGQVGESVLVEIDRNGESIQLTIPRGPIGVSAGRRF